MADNDAFQGVTPSYAPTALIVATDKVTYSGDADVSQQVVHIAGVTGAEGSKTVLEIIGTAGSASTGVVTIQGVGSGTAVPVSVASVPSHAVTNAGTFAVQLSAAGGLTALELIDNIVAVEDAAAAGGESGVPILAVRRDVASSGVSADGDFANLSVDSTGALRVAGSSGTTQYAEDAAHVSGDSVVFVGAIRRDTTPSSSSGTAGDYSAINVDANGRLYTQAVLYNSSGTELTADTQGTQDTALGTITSVTGSMVLGRASTTAPTAVSAADDAVLPWMTLNGAQVTTPIAHTTGGCAIFRSLDLDETEEDIKTSAGQVYGAWVTNTATSTRWLKFYNAAAASVTVGTTTPVITIGIPGNTSDDISANFGPGGMGVVFDTAICVAATTGVADADTGAPAANDVIVNIFYK